MSSDNSDIFLDKLEEAGIFLPEDVTLDVEKHLGPRDARRAKYDLAHPSHQKEHLGTATPSLGARTLGALLSGIRNLLTIEGRSDMFPVNGVTDKDVPGFEEIRDGDGTAAETKAKEAFKNIFGYELKGNAATAEEEMLEHSITTALRGNKGEGENISVDDITPERLIQIFQDVETHYQSVGDEAGVDRVREKRRGFMNSTSNAHLENRRAKGDEPSDADLDNIERNVQETAEKEELKSTERAFNEQKDQPSRDARQQRIQDARNRQIERGQRQMYVTEAGQGVTEGREEEQAQRARLRPQPEPEPDKGFVEMTEREAEALRDAAVARRLSGARGTQGVDAGEDDDMLGDVGDLSPEQIKAVDRAKGELVSSGDLESDEVDDIRPLDVKELYNDRIGGDAFQGTEALPGEKPYLLSDAVEAAEANREARRGQIERVLGARKLQELGQGLTAGDARNTFELAERELGPVVETAEAWEQQGLVRPGMGEELRDLHNRVQARNKANRLSSDLIRDYDNLSEDERDNIVNEIEALGQIHGGLTATGAVDSLTDTMRRYQAPSRANVYTMRDKMAAVIGRDVGNDGVKTIDEMSKQKYKGKPTPAKRLKQSRDFVDKKAKEMFVNGKVAERKQEKMRQGKGTSLSDADMAEIEAEYDAMVDPRAHPGLVKEHNELKRAAVKEHAASLYDKLTDKDLDENERIQAASDIKTMQVLVDRDRLFAATNDYRIASEKIEKERDFGRAEQELVNSIGRRVLASETRDEKIDGALPIRTSDEDVIGLLSSYGLKGGQKKQMVDLLGGYRRAMASQDMTPDEKRDYENATFDVIDKIFPEEGSYAWRSAIDPDLSFDPKDVESPRDMAKRIFRQNALKGRALSAFANAATSEGSRDSALKAAQLLSAPDGNVNIASNRADLSAAADGVRAALNNLPDETKSLLSNSRVKSARNQNAYKMRLNLNSDGGDIDATEITSLLLDSGASEAEISGGARTREKTAEGAEIMGDIPATAANVGPDGQPYYGLDATVYNVEDAQALVQALEADPRINGVRLAPGTPDTQIPEGVDSFSGDSNRLVYAFDHAPDNALLENIADHLASKGHKDFSIRRTQTAGPDLAKPVQQGIEIDVLGDDSGNRSKAIINDLRGATGLTPGGAKKKPFGEPLRQERAGDATTFTFGTSNSDFNRTLWQSSDLLHPYKMSIEDTSGLFGAPEVSKAVRITNQDGTPLTDEEKVSVIDTLGRLFPAEASIGVDGERVITNPYFDGENDDLSSGYSVDSLLGAVDSLLGKDKTHLHNIYTLTDSMMSPAMAKLQMAKELGMFEGDEDKIDALHGSLRELRDKLSQQVRNSDKASLSNLPNPDDYAAIWEEREGIRTVRSEVRAAGGKLRKELARDGIFRDLAAADDKQTRDSILARAKAKINKVWNDEFKDKVRDAGKNAGVKNLDWFENDLYSRMYASAMPHDAPSGWRRKVDDIKERMARKYGNDRRSRTPDRKIEKVLREPHEFVGPGRLNKNEAARVLEGDIDPDLAEKIARMAIMDSAGTSNFLGKASDNIPEGFKFIRQTEDGEEEIEVLGKLSGAGQMERETTFAILDDDGKVTRDEETVSFNDEDGAKALLGEDLFNELSGRDEDSMYAGELIYSDFFNPLQDAGGPERQGKADEYRAETVPDLVSSLIMEGDGRGNAIPRSAEQRRVFELPDGRKAVASSDELKVNPRFKVKSRRAETTIGPTGAAHVDLVEEDKTIEISDQDAGELLDPSRRNYIGGQAVLQSPIGDVVPTFDTRYTHQDLLDDATDYAMFRGGSKFRKNQFDKSKAQTQASKQTGQAIAQQQTAADRTPFASADEVKQDLGVLPSEFSPPKNPGDSLHIGIVGARSADDDLIQQLVGNILDGNEKNNPTVVSGAAPGVDSIGEQAARDRGHGVISWNPRDKNYLNGTLRDDLLGEELKKGLSMAQALLRKKNKTDKEKQDLKKLMTKIRAMGLMDSNGKPMSLSKIDWMKIPNYRNSSQVNGSNVMYAFPRFEQRGGGGTGNTVRKATSGKGPKAEQEVADVKGTNIGVQSEKPILSFWVGGDNDARKNSKSRAEVKALGKADKIRDVEFANLDMLTPEEKQDQANVVESMLANSGDSFTDDAKQKAQALIETLRSTAPAPTPQAPPPQRGSGRQEKSGKDIRKYTVGPYNEVDKDRYLIPTSKAADLDDPDEGHTDGLGALSPSNEDLKVNVGGVDFDFGALVEALSYFNPRAQEEVFTRNLTDGLDGAEGVRNDLGFSDRYDLLRLSYGGEDNDQMKSLLEGLIQAAVINSNGENDRLNSTLVALRDAMKKGKRPVYDRYDPDMHLGAGRMDALGDYHAGYNILGDAVRDSGVNLAAEDFDGFVNSVFGDAQYKDFDIPAGENGLNFLGADKVRVFRDGRVLPINDRFGDKESAMERLDRAVQRTNKYRVGNDDAMFSDSPRDREILNSPLVTTSPRDLDPNRDTGTPPDDTEPPEGPGDIPARPAGPEGPQPPAGEGAPEPDFNDIVSGSEDVDTGVRMDPDVGDITDRAYDRPGTIVGNAVNVSEWAARNERTLGLAQSFRESDPENFQQWRDAVLNGDLTEGKVLITDRQGGGQIVNIPTKGTDLRNPATPERIKAGLEDFSRQIGEDYSGEIILPQLGGGLGKLDFDKDVKPLVDEFAARHPNAKVSVAGAGAEAQGLVKPPDGNAETSNGFRDEYAFLSNFHASPVQFEGATYPTVEHAFQAAKTMDPDAREEIRNARTPGEAKKLGRKVDLRPDWEDVKVGIMEDLVRAKFSDPELRRQLDATEGTDLVEYNNWGDKFWGVSGGDGENQMGQILERIRSGEEAEATEVVEAADNLNEIRDLKDRVDNQRDAMYDAETEALLNSPRIIGGQRGLQAKVDSILDSDWWKENYPNVESVNVEVIPEGDMPIVRDDQRARSLANQTHKRIRFSDDTRAHTEGILLHELAHLATDYSGEGVEPHGPEWARNHLDIIRNVQGEQSALERAQAYRENGVDFAVSKPTPVSDEEPDASGLMPVAPVDRALQRYEFMIDAYDGDLALDPGLIGMTDEQFEQAYNSMANNPQARKELESRLKEAASADFADFLSTPVGTPEESAKRQKAWEILLGYDRAINAENDLFELAGTPEAKRNHDDILSGIFSDLPLTIRTSDIKDFNNTWVSDRLNLIERTFDEMNELSESRQMLRSLNDRLQLDPNSEEDRKLAAEIKDLNDRVDNMDDPYDAANLDRRLSRLNDRLLDRPEIRNLPGDERERIMAGEDPTSAPIQPDTSDFVPPPEDGTNIIYASPEYPGRPPISGGEEMSEEELDQLLEEARQQQPPRVVPKRGEPLFDKITDDRADKLLAALDADDDDELAKLEDDFRNRCDLGPEDM